MNVSGKVLKASVVRGRDSYELEIRIQLTDGKCDVYAPTSGYVNSLATIALVEVPADYWQPPPPDAESPKPADYAFAPLPPPEPAKPPKEEKPKAAGNAPIALGDAWSDMASVAPLPLPPIPEPDVVTSAPTHKKTTRKKED
jgi:hypothetical protein